MWMQEWTDEQLRHCPGSGVAPEALRAGLLEEAHRHRMRKVEQGEGRVIMDKQLAGIRDALTNLIQKVEAADPRVRLLLGHTGPLLKLQILQSERDFTENMRRLLEFGAEIMVEHGTRIPDDTKLATYLCRGLSDLYTTLTGKTGVGRDSGGPRSKFVQWGFALIDPELPCPGIRSAVRRGPKRVVT
jgi:hypothetical protein